MYKENERIPMSDWGKDHWSQLAFVFVWVARGSGCPKKHMSCNTARHPHGASEHHAMLANAGTWRPDNGIRLKGYFNGDKTTNPDRLLGWADDWDCMEDFYELGLIDYSTGHQFWQGEVWLTEKGVELGAEVMKHKARGGNFATFEPSPEHVSWKPVTPEDRRASDRMIAAAMLAAAQENSEVAIGLKT